MSASIGRIIEMTGQQDVSIAELSRAVAADPGLSVRVLRQVNSTLLSRGVQIASIHKAVSRLGVQGVRLLAIGAAATGGQDARAFYPFDLARFWEDSLRRAAASEVLAGTSLFSGIEPSSAFMAGLLQDLPVLALIRSDPAKATAWMSMVGEDPILRRREEQALFGCTHDEIAGDVQLAWGLPDGVAIPMRYHHEPARAPTRYYKQCRLHQLAEGLAAVLGADDTSAAWQRARALLASVDGFQDNELDGVLEQVARRVSTAARALGMGVSEQPDLRELRRRARRSEEMFDLTRHELVAWVRKLAARNDGLRRELVHLREMVEVLSATDAVTGLPDRRALDVRLGLELRRAARSGVGLSVLWLEIAADRVVPVDAEQQFAVGVGATMRTTDLVTRFDAGCLVVVLPDTAENGAFVAARRALGGARGEGRGSSAEWAAGCGLAWIQGTPSEALDFDELAERLIARARENAQAALERGRAVVRTGRESVPWGVEQ